MLRNIRCIPTYYFLTPEGESIVISSITRLNYSYYCGGPRITHSITYQRDPVPLLNLTPPLCALQRYRDRGGNSITGHFQVDTELVRRDFHFCAKSLQREFIGLVQDKIVNIRDA